MVITASAYVYEALSNGVGCFTEWKDSLLCSWHPATRLCLATETQWTSSRRTSLGSDIISSYHLHLCTPRCLVPSSLHNIFTMIKSKRMRCAQHRARVTEYGNAYKHLTRKSEDKRTTRTVKIHLTAVWCGLDTPPSGQETAVGCWKHGTVPSHYINSLSTKSPLCAVKRRFT